MAFLEWIAQYWVQWFCALIGGGILLFGRYFLKLQKQVNENEWKNKEATIINTVNERIDEVAQQSSEEDIHIHEELNGLHTEIDLVETGILSIQGKQFIDQCKVLLENNHVITVDEYEFFETEYAVYKQLGGNHTGDTLHARVVDKFRTQM